MSWLLWIAPANDHAEYKIGAACPFDSTNLSLAKLAGSAGS